jgi:hypothetical protein
MSDLGATVMAYLVGFCALVVGVGLSTQVDAWFILLAVGGGVLVMCTVCRMFGKGRHV